MTVPASPPSPRNASTVVVTRPSAGTDRELEVYMVRRSAKSPFMPSTLVFPGGRLDDEDGSPDDDRAWERAARRECGEEASLDPGEDLVWFDTWLTPSAEPRRRYLARFFWAALRPGDGEDAHADGFETHDGRWARVSAHIEAWDKGEVDLPPPTLCTLLRLAELGAGAIANLRDVDPSGAILPKFVLQDGEPIIVMPHDPQYASLPGESMPAPARVASLPRRFVRDERVWRPCEGS